MAWNRDITNFECGKKHTIEEHKWDHLKEYDCEEDYYFDDELNKKKKYSKPFIQKVQSDNDVLGAGLDFDKIYNKTTGGDDSDPEEDDDPTKEIHSATAVFDYTYSEGKTYESGIEPSTDKSEESYKEITFKQDVSYTDDNSICGSVFNEFSKTRWFISNTSTGTSITIRMYSSRQSKLVVYCDNDSVISEVIIDLDNELKEMTKNSQEITWEAIQPTQIQSIKVKTESKSNILARSLVEPVIVYNYIDTIEDGE